MKIPARPLVGPAPVRFLDLMADTTGNTQDIGAQDGPGPQPRKSSWRYIGPGIVVAATGVGAGDLVATLIA